MKRGAGEGSIYRRKDGRWAAMLTVEGGRRKFPDDRVTVGQFLERWLEESARPRVRPWTYRGYEVHVRLQATVLEHLRDHRQRQADEQLACGLRWRNRMNLLFTTAKGDPLHGSVVTHLFQAKLEASGLRRLRFHDLRHSCDSLLQAQGVPPRVVMDILGHTTLAMTMERYAKALPEAKHEAARRMDLLFSGDQ